MLMREQKTKRKLNFDVLRVPFVPLELHRVYECWDMCEHRTHTHHRAAYADAIHYAFIHFLLFRLKN